MYPDEEIKRISDRLKIDFPECKIMTLSSVTGEGVQDWLETAMNSADSGSHIIDLDDNKYAEGEESRLAQLCCQPFGERC